MVDATQLGKIAPLALGVLLVAIMIAFAALVSNDVYEDEVINTSTAVAITTQINLNSSASVPLKGMLLEQNTVVVKNSSTGNGSTLGTGNYTTTRDPPTIIGVSTSAYNGTIVNISYTYMNTSVPTSAAAANNGTVSMANLSGYIPTISVIGIAGILIAFVVSIFVFRRR